MELEWFVVLNLNFYNMISYDVNYRVNVTIGQK